MPAQEIHEPVSGRLHILASTVPYDLDDFLLSNPYINPKPLNPNEIQRSMENLYQLLVHAIEAVAFISYLIDAGFPTVVQR